MVQLKRIALLAAAAFVLVGVLVAGSSRNRTGPGTGLSPQATVSAVYFHRAQRCATCRALEAMCRDAVKASFPGEVERGELVFQSIDIDAPGNGHYLRDYGLVSQSLVLVRAGEPTAFRTLDRIWELMGDAAAFRDYVRSETARFLQHERAT